jgi:acetoin utilization deacetylase AcuC-like enzyme
MTNNTHGITGLHIDSVYVEHDAGNYHPESPDRVRAIEMMLHQTGWDKLLPRIGGRAATEDELALVHTRDYIELVRRETAAGARMLSTGDTPLSARSFEVASAAVGGTLNSVDAVVAGAVRNAFCIVRPPGHHATPKAGMGFCLFNNVAIAARYATKTHGLDRVAIVDWDVHHGNGTQDAFYEDDSVLFFSIHQAPWYPGTGRTEETGAGRGSNLTINCPFPAETGREEILASFRDKLMPALDAFRPDLILISAGFDSKEGDPLGRFLLSDEDFDEMTSLMQEAADKHANGRVVSVLEGGYGLGDLASAVKSHLTALGRV